MPYFVIPGDPDPSKEVAAEILRRHRDEEKEQKEPWLASFLSSLIHKLFRPTPPKPGTTQVATHRSPPTPRPRPQATQRRGRVEGALVSLPMRIPSDPWRQLCSSHSLHLDRRYHCPLAGHEQAVRPDHRVPRTPP